MPETTVIIPTYNRRAFLEEAVQSVLAQTYRDFELIVVDDGSSDDTAIFCESNRQRLRYFRQENSGPSAARNLGIARAQGVYLTFLDSDDLWAPRKLEIQIEFMKMHPQAMVCYTDEIWIRRGVRVNQKKKHRKYSGWIFEHCVPLCIVSPSSVLMRRDFFDRAGLFDETLPVCEDYDLWLRASLQFPFHYIDTPLITKRGGRKDQLSAAWGLDCYRVRALQALLRDANLEPEQKQLALKTLLRKASILEQGFRKRGKSKEAVFYHELTQEVTATLDRSQATILKKS